jgi:hypothetical protein
LFETFEVKANHDFIVNDECWGGATFVLADQVIDGIRIATYIALFECNSSLREVGRSGVARRSTGLGEHNNVVRGHLFTA